MKLRLSPLLIAPYVMLALVGCQSEPINVDSPNINPALLGTWYRIDGLAIYGESVEADKSTDGTLIITHTQVTIHGNAISNAAREAFVRGGQVYSRDRNSGVEEYFFDFITDATIPNVMIVVADTSSLYRDPLKSDQPREYYCQQGKNCYFNRSAVMVSVYTPRWTMPGTGETLCTDHVVRAGPEYDGWTDLQFVNCTSITPSSERYGQEGHYGYLQTDMEVRNDGTVLEHSTGLVWQSAYADDILSWNASSQYCGDLSLGGADDWRLPTKHERHIMQQGQPSRSPELGNLIYVQPNDTSIAYTRCISDTLSSSYEQTVTRFALVNPDVVEDKATGLHWLRATIHLDSLGLSACEDSDIGGFADWRIPNYNELYSLLLFDPLLPHLRFVSEADNPTMYSRYRYLDPLFIGDGVVMSNTPSRIALEYPFGNGEINTRLVEYPYFRAVNFDEGVEYFDQQFEAASSTRCVRDATEDSDR